MRHALGVILLLVVGSANAAPVTWTVDATWNASFDTDDGVGQLAGTFDYNADTGIYSNIDLVSTCSIGICQDFFGASINSFFQGNDTFMAADGLTSIDAPVQVNLSYSDVLTDSGGDFSLEFNSQISGFLAQDDGALTGTVSAVPIPAAVWLFGSALAGLGWMRRRQTA
jgi:hypothetical protein